MSVVIIAVVAFIVANIVGYRIAQPISWWLFRRFHQNNPEALAFAHRCWPVGTPTSDR